MSYSLSIEIKNDNLFNQMKKFLEDNKNILDEMNKNEGIYFHNEVCENDFSVYVPKNKKLLGFHGSSIPRYIVALCAWISFKTECKNSKGLFFYYDSEKIYLTQDKNENKYLIDNEGIFIIRKYKQTILQKIFLNQNYLNKNQILLKKLNDNWNQLNYNSSKKPKI